MSGWLWAAAGAAVLALVLFRLAVRSGLGLVFLWLFQSMGPLVGVHLGVNLLNGLVLGLLGAPGFALLLMAQWASS